jgi:hypothetical protein
VITLKINESNKQIDDIKSKEPVNCRFYKSRTYENRIAHNCHYNKYNGIYKNDIVSNFPRYTCPFGKSGCIILAKPLCKYYCEKITDSKPVIPESVLLLNSIDDKVVEVETKIEEIYKSIDELKNQLMNSKK